MEAKNKRLRKIILFTFFVIIVLAVVDNIFEDYIKYLFSENKIIYLLIILPIAFYLFNKIERSIDKTISESSISKHFLKSQKDYGEKKWYHGKCYNCNNNTLTTLIEKGVPIGKKLKCTECESINKKTIPQNIMLMPLLIYGVFEFFDILDAYKLQLLVGSLLLTIIFSAVISYLWVNIKWEK